MTHRKGIRGLENKKFNNLKIIRLLGPQNGHIMWECQCACGKLCKKRGSSLVSGTAVSCGCIKGKKHIKDLTGQRFGRLMVLKQTPTNKSKYAFWLCLCDCGKKVTVKGTNLRYKQTSCGCGSWYSSRDHKQSLIKWIVRMYKGGATGRFLSFELSDEEFIKIIQNPCHYCGFQGRDWGAKWYQEKLRRIKTRQTKCHDDSAKNISLIGNGIDRIINNQGYTIENCVPCCQSCNWMKKDLTEQEFLNHIKQISSYRKL